MGVYIPKMEVPKRCADCILFDYPSVYCELLRLDALDDVDVGNTRSKDCPLIEVPPHGRLIDADAFRKANGLGEDCENCHRNTRTCNYDVCLSRMDVCGWVDDAPTIIEAEADG